MKTLVRRAIVAVLFAVGLALALPHGATADPAAQPRATEEDFKDVPSTLYYMHGSNPAATGNCVAAIFATFEDIKGWYPNYASAAHAGENVLDPPYDDTYTVYPGLVWTAPPGYHWKKIGQSSRSGASPNDCSDLSAAQQASNGPTGTVSFKITDECWRDREYVRDAQAAVDKAKKKVKKTSGRAHDKAVEKLKKVKKDLKKMKQRFDKSCTP